MAPTVVFKGLPSVRQSVQVEVQLFGPFRETVGQKTVECELEAGARVDDALDELIAAYPDLGGRFRTTAGALRGDVNVTRNGKHVRQLDEEKTELEEGDRIRIAPPIKGGAQK